RQRSRGGSPPSAAASFPAIPQVDSSRLGGQPLMLVSYTPFGEARRARRKQTLAQVVPPREGYAGNIKRQEDCQCHVKTTRGGDRGAKPPRAPTARINPSAAAPSRLAAFKASARPTSPSPFASLRFSSRKIAGIIR